MHIQCDQLHPILAVADVPAAADFYVTKLGFRVAFTESDWFAGVNLGQVQIFLERGEPGAEGFGVYFVVGDVEELCAFHRANGVEILVEPGDRPYGLRDYTVRDRDGYRLTFGQRLADPHRHA